MVYSIAWNEASPAGASTNASTLDTELQNLKISLRERMNQLLDSSTAWETDANDPKLLDVLALAGTPEVAVVYDSTNPQVVTTGSTDIILWDTELLDTGGFHSTSTNTGRFTIVEAGYYRLIAHIQLVAGAAAGQLTTQIRKNGTNIRQNSTPSISGDLVVLVTSEIVLAAATDYYDVTLNHTTGVNVNITMSATTSFFSIERINGTT